MRHGHSKRGSKSPTYSSWTAMIARCTYPSSAGFAHYRRLGITVCDRWRYGDGVQGGFACFLADMGERPTREHSLDRYPDNAGNYEPGNCRWATKREQQNNMRSNRLFEYGGEMLSYAEIARRTGIPMERLRHRLVRAGWTVEEAIKQDRKPGKRPYETIRDIAERAGVEYRVFAERIRAGWSMEDAITKPIRGRK